MTLVKYVLSIVQGIAATSLNRPYSNGGHFPLQSGWEKNTSHSCSSPLTHNSSVHSSVPTHSCLVCENSIFPSVLQHAAPTTRDSTNTLHSNCYGGCWAYLWRLLMTAAAQKT